MPSRTARQHRAMEAAAHRKSILGIPKKVAQEFVNADKGGKFEHVTKVRARNNRR